MVVIYKKKFGIYRKVGEAKTVKSAYKKIGQGTSPKVLRKGKFRIGKSRYLNQKN